MKPKRGILVVLVVLIASFFVSAKTVLFVNPTIPAGGSNTFALDGHSSPTSGLDWDIVRSGSTIATSSSTNGWTVSHPSSNFTVGAPSSATVNTNYQVRWLNTMSANPVERTARTTAAPIFKDPRAPAISDSAFFDAIDSIPSAPSNLTLLGMDSNSVRLTIQDNASNETSFLISRKVSGGSYAEVGSAPCEAGAPPCHAGTGSYTFDDPESSPLTTGNTYYYKVLARNASGDSAYCTEMSVKMLPPLTPGSVTSTSNSITLNWTYSTNPTQFTVFWRKGTTGGYTFKENVLGSLRTCVHTGLDSNSIYQYKIRAYEATTYSDVWAPTQSTTP